ncbi:hypothetical protein AB0E62_06765 [Streptomyces sp. NPDC038707]
MPLLTLTEVGALARAAHHGQTDRPTSRTTPTRGASPPSPSRSGPG